ncbi:MAG: hypothetical protein AB7G75_30330 [Candidatus Binatia bacterium]
MASESDPNLSNNTVAALTTVDAAPQTFSLMVTVQGDGTVSSTPTGISCPGDCTEAYPTGTAVTLRATSLATIRFIGWSGACTGKGLCRLTMTQNLSVTASFAPKK